MESLSIRFLKGPHLPSPDAASIWLERPGQLSGNGGIIANYAAAHNIICCIMTVS
jgi:hypothetical protein